MMLGDLILQLVTVFAIGVADRAVIPVGGHGGLRLTKGPPSIGQGSQFNALLRCRDRGGSALEKGG